MVNVRGRVRILLLLPIGLVPRATFVVIFVARIVAGIASFAGATACALKCFDTLLHALQTRLVADLSDLRLEHTNVLLLLQSAISRQVW